MQKEEYFS